MLVRDCVLSRLLVDSNECILGLSRHGGRMLDNVISVPMKSLDREL